MISDASFSRVPKNLRDSKDFKDLKDLRSSAKLTRVIGQRNVLRLQSHLRVFAIPAACVAHLPIVAFKTVNPIRETQNEFERVNSNFAGAWAC